jgi:hypothetical protein
MHIFLQNLKTQASTAPCAYHEDGSRNSSLPEVCLGCPRRGAIEYRLKASNTHKRHSSNTIWRPTKKTYTKRELKEMLRDEKNRIEIEKNIVFQRKPYGRRAEIYKGYEELKRKDHEQYKWFNP